MFVAWDRVVAGLGEPARQSDQAVGHVSARSKLLNSAVDRIRLVQAVVAVQGDPVRKVERLRLSPFQIPASHGFPLHFRQRKSKLYHLSRTVTSYFLAGGRSATPTLRLDSAAASGRRSSFTNSE